MTGIAIIASTTKVIAQARLDGQMSALRGADFTHNPHPLGSSASRAWSRGYREIAEARS